MRWLALLRVESFDSDFGRKSGSSLVVEDGARHWRVFLLLLELLKK